MKRPGALERSIQLRLMRTLLGAFGATVVLTVLLLLGVVALAFNAVASQDVFYRSPLVAVLESYYQGRGSWENVAQVSRLQAGNMVLDWRATVLLDEQGRVLLDRGQVDSPLVGQGYTPATDDILVPINPGDRTVGTLIILRAVLTRPLRLVLAALGPSLFISLVLGLMTLVVGLMLARRVVDPLAQVIAAAQHVAAGDLSARVPLSPRSDDLHVLGENFNQMADALERSDRERRDLLADIAHELRTPLTVLRGRLEGILDGVYPPDEAHIAPALEETYLLERLVEDLRLLTLAERGQLHFELRPCQLGELAERSVSLFAAQAGEKGIRLEITSDPTLPEVQADPQRIEQVIGNLLGNALRFTPEGGQVQVQVTAQAGGVNLTVLDRGPGVPEEDLDHIFERFWRGEKSRSRLTGGAGLGLAIARHLVQAQGGTIEARNRDGGGLEVGFWIKGQKE